MSVDLQLPKEPIEAAELLASLETKDETMCRYPACPNPRQVATGISGQSLTGKHPFSSHVPFS
ncbi:MAG TPA: hypothetical protein VGN34_28350 [Ktedonobacteraceae bacterium]|jgi:hypothetical protein